MISYQGKTGFIWFTGVVEDRNDPLFLNRVRVRVHGAHSYDKQNIATTDLPWSEVMMPTTSPSLSGLGTTTHGLVEGSTVMGFYRDYLNMQDPVIIGSFVGIPQEYYRIDEQIDDKGNRKFQQIARTTTEGFNDPRLDSESSYEGTPDGKNPKHINRNYGLTLGLDKSPRRSGETKGEIYPKASYLGTSDVNVLARNYDDKTYPIIETVEGEPKRDYVEPVYPFNHVHETESGHVLELDDTPDKERIHLFHRTGSRYEIDKDGNRVEKIIKDAYTVVLGNDTVTVTGNVAVNVTGNTVINTTGTTTVNSTGDTDVTTPNTLITSNVKIDGTLNVTGAQTNDSTITAEGEITSGSVTLTKHTHIDTAGLGPGKTTEGTG